MNMKLAVIIVVLLNIAWDFFMEVLDRRSLKNALPECVADVYDEAEYKKWRAYKGEKKRMSVIAKTVNYAVVLVLLVFDCYAAFAKLFPENIYAQLFSVILLDAVIGIITDIPFSLYSTFVIEAKYGFNRTTAKTFVLDQIKELLLGLLLTGGLISLFAAIHQAAGSWFIPVLTGALIALTLLMSLITPALTRIFNKFRPLEDGELRQRLTQLLTSHGYKVRAVEVMDASRRSTKMNAYFTGIGPTKTIVLFDTMTEKMTEEQICAVFAHEMGHGIHHDIIRTRILSAFEMLLIACAAWFVVNTPAFFTDCGFAGINYGFAFILLGWVLSIISPLTGLIGSQFSRRAEYRADATAADEGYGEALISGLKLLAKNNLSDLAPDPLLVKLTYSHPTLAQRIEAIEKKLHGAE
ncbi:MAG: M48 family metallopeptidase [Clostridia bacterium]|nr:M48 family metallopeptidase [Clostridia bacterium]